MDAASQRKTGEEEDLTGGRSDRKEAADQQQEEQQVTPGYAVSCSLLNVLTMRSVCVCLCFLALLLPRCVQSQASRPALARLDEDSQRDVLAVDFLNRYGVLDSLLRSEHHLVLRRARAPRPAPRAPKRAQQGSRFALSLDVPTSILSVLIDLAKNQDMRSKAAANAELMARIGKRK